MDKKSRRTLEFDKVLERLADYTSFSAGRALALLVEPTTDLDLARRWQAETQEALVLLDSRTDIGVGGARDVRRPADNAQRGFVLLPEDFLNIRATIAAGRDLQRKLIKLEEKCPNLYEIALLIEECPGLISAIGNTLDERGDVLDSASTQLAHIRRQLRIVHDRIHDKLQSLISSSNNQYLQEPTITTRGGRYVVPLMANHKGRIRGIVHDQSNSGATLWIEPLNTVDLNNEFRGLKIAEQDEIQRILAELSVLVAEQGEAIKRVVERMAELDLIFARARYAAVTESVQPEFVAWRQTVPSWPPQQTKELEKLETTDVNRHPGCTFWIRGARHPLLEPDSVVAIDLTLDEETFVMLITGPNTGGKTVSLKTAGLMALMAQSGLHLPALEARLTVFQNIFADIGDEQSIEQNLSTFSGHLTNIIRIVREVDDRSLVLLDELGSGTDPAEGAALAQAIVSYLYDIGATTLVATHFPELKLYASQTPGATNASLLFDVDTLMPTFEMSIGVPGRSNAFAIARRLGLDASILDEGLRLIGSSSSKTDSLLDTIYQMREKIASQEAGTRLALHQAEEERNRLQSQLEQIEVERRQILAGAKEEAQKELDAVRREIRQVRRRLRDAESLNKLKKLQKRTEQVEEEVLAQKDVEPLETQIQSTPRRAPSDLQEGDSVMVVPLGTTGKIISLDKQEAVVAVGRLHMRAQLDELEFKEREEEQDASPVASGTPKSSPGMELDLRGKRVDEGLQVLDQYLDSAFLSNLPWVRIIHGKGTGRLREAVRQALKQNSHVLSFEEGRDGEGGAGVTIAKFEEAT